MQHNQSVCTHTHTHILLLLQCPPTPPQLQAHTFIIHCNQISEVVEESCFSLSLSLSLSFLPLSHSLYLHPLPAPPLHSSPLLSQERIAFIATNTLWSPRLSAVPASHWCRQSGKQAAKQPGSPPRQENEQFSHCNNAPLSSSHYRHDKRWNIQGGWPPNLIWARYWACGKWVLSALIYSLADWPLKLNIITERIFKKPGPQITSKWKY